MKGLFNGWRKKIKGEDPLTKDQIKEIFSYKSIIVSEDTRKENRVSP